MRKLILCGLTLVFLVLGCSQENRDSKIDKKASQAAWNPAMVEGIGVAQKPTEASAHSIKERAKGAKSSSLSHSFDEPLKEPDAVNGLVPYIEATPKLSESPLVQALRKSAHGKVQVIEFFNYPCPWCAHIDPTLQGWLTKKPKEVIFIRVPVLFHPNWSIFSKCYYLIEALAKEKGIENTAPLHAAFFDKVSKNLEIGHDIPAIYAFFVEKGLIKANAEPAFTEMLNNTDDHADLFFAYRIKAIPTFVVQGNKGIYSTNLNAAGDSENVFRVVDYLTVINR